MTTTETPFHLWRIPAVAVVPDRFHPPTLARSWVLLAAVLVVILLGLGVCLPVVELLRPVPQPAPPPPHHSTGALPDAMTETWTASPDVWAATIVSYQSPRR